MWGEKCGRAGQATDNTIIWRVKATNTHSEYLIPTAFLRQQWLR